MKTGNPYPGPRPLTRDDRIYGRSVELRRLTNLLVGERIVLLYSPAGAGKTSLLLGGLLPRLDRAGYRILGPIRPGLGLGVGGAAAGNRYAAASVDALRDQTGLPLELPPGATLADCFTALGPPPPRPCRLGAQLEEAEAGGGESEQPRALDTARQKLWQADLLVFDQFEEVLLADPGDHAGRREFFEQLGEVLRDRNRWALFSMREEHIAALDAYRRPIPTQLRTTVRLDLLGIPEAIEAIRGPAERAGVSFPEDIAERLALNLAGAGEAEGGAGSAGDGAGPAAKRWVEPVQLQVVCQRIWNKLGPEDTAITELTQIGTVDEALRGYYADSVQDAAQQSGYRERKLREWVQDELITPSGTRNQFLWEKRPETASRDGAIERLDKSHLVRAESRRDVLWIELAHDRLVKPVLDDNRAWLDRTLQPFQKRAQAWERTGGADLLLTGPALAEAEAWAKDPDHRAELDEHPGEADFLKESRDAEQERLRKRRQRRQAIAAGVALALVAVGVLAFLLVQADRTSRQELSRRLGFDAVEARNGQPSLALLLAANAFRAWNTFEARSSLVAALSPEGQPAAEFDTSEAGVDGPAAQGGGLRPTVASTGSSVAKPAGGTLAETGETVADLTSVAVSPDGRWVAASARDGMIYVWDTAKKGRPTTVAIQGAAAIERLAYSPDGSMMAVGDRSGKVWLFANRSPVLEPLGSFVAEPDTINGMAWGANGALYTLGKGDLGQWQVSERAASEVARRPAPDARALAISPAHDFLAVAYENGSVAEWRLDENGGLPAGPDEPLQGNANTPSAIAVADTGEIAVAYENGLVVRWPRGGTPARRVRFTGSMDSLVTGLAWGPGGKFLAASGRDHQALVWDIEKGGVAERWRGHSDAVQAITFDPDGTHCFTAGQDGR
ncbi:MAG: WD40 repeat domain-containing protein, partial [Nitrososphaerales archaeon]